MDDEMDYDQDEYRNQTDNRLMVSNIHNMNQDPVENENLRAIKLFQLLNINSFNNINNINSQQLSQEELNKKKKKQNMINLLLAARGRLDDLINFLRLITFERSIYKLKVFDFTSIDTSSEKTEMKKINYLKKVDCFKKSLDIFTSNLQKISDKNKISEIIFRELTVLKEFGFYVEESFNFPEIKEVITLKLIHKLVKIYQNLNIQISSIFTEKQLIDKFYSKYSFDLTYNIKTDNFELTNQFYENFSKKYRIKFDLKIKTEEGIFAFDKKNFEILLNDLIIENLELNSVYRKQFSQNTSYNLKSYMVFYVKYFLYILFKTEVRSIIKISGNNYFQYQNFHFSLTENIKEFTYHVNSFNYFEFSFKVLKEEIGMEDNYERKMYENDIDRSDNVNLMNIELTEKGNTKSSEISMMIFSKTVNEKDSITSRMNSIIIEKYSTLLRILLKNLIHDMKVSNIIKDLTKLKFENKSAIADIIDFSIFAKNISKICQVFLRNCIVFKLSKMIEQSKSFYIIKHGYINIFVNTFVYKYLLIRNSSLNLNSFSKIEFHLIFNKSNLTVEFKTPIKNNVFVCERDIISENLYKNVDIHYLVSMINCLISN